MCKKQNDVHDGCDVVLKMKALGGLSPRSASDAGCADTGQRGFLQLRGAKVPNFGIPKRCVFNICGKSE